MALALQLNGARLEKCVYLFKGSAPAKSAPDAAYVKP